MAEAQTTLENNPGSGTEGEPEPGEPAGENEIAEVAGAGLSADLKDHKLDEMGGAKVGKVQGRVVGESGGREWLLARMGRFGHYCLVPSRDAVVANGRVWVPYSRDQIRRAPRVEPDAPLEGELEQAITAHYGLS